MEYIQNFFHIVIDIFIQNPLWQTIGLIAFLVSIYNFLFCKNKRFVFFTMVASLVWWIHFGILWLTSAALVNGIDVIKNGLALKYEKNKYLTLIFVVLYIIIWFLTYSSPISLIPTINALLWTFLVFYVRWVWLNIGFMFVIVLWWVYNFLWQSIWGFMTDIALLVTGVIWVVRILLEEKKQKEEK